MHSIICLSLAIVSLVLPIKGLKDKISNIIDNMFFVNDNKKEIEPNAYNNYAIEVFSDSNAYDQAFNHFTQITPTGSAQ